MAKLVDHYAALGVRPDADAAEIRRAWIRAARANHPDRRNAAGPQQSAQQKAEQSARSDQRMRAVNEAWRVLGRAESRRTYDIQRAAEAPPQAPATSAPNRTAANGVSREESRDEAWTQDDFAPAFSSTGEPGGPGGFVVRHRGAALVVRVLPWAVAAVVGIGIFVATAYMSADTSEPNSPVAALEIGECFWVAPNGTLRTVECDWPQNDGVLDQIITVSASDRCRHPDATVHAAPIAGRRLCLVPVDLWQPPAPPTSSAP